jgi:hypothetical protein
VAAPGRLRERHLPVSALVQSVRAHRPDSTRRHPGTLTSESGHGTARELSAARMYLRASHGHAASVHANTRTTGYAEEKSETTLVVNVQLSRRHVHALFVLLLISFVAAACGSGSSSPSSSTTGSSTTQAAKAEAGPTLSNLTSSVEGQITGTGSNDFSVGGVNKVTCTPPAIWKPGATFKCYAYDFAMDEMGEYDGTVVADSGGVPQWDGLWSPK